MKILITGGSGVIGSKLVENFSKKGNSVFYTYLNNNLNLKNANAINLDVSNRDKVNSVVDKIKPDLIIHTVSVPSVDLCETNHELADKINIQGTKNIADPCKKNNCKLVFVSTSFIFDDMKIYDEDGDPHPVNYYGQTKLEGEKITKESGQPYLILRTDQPYCWIKNGQKKNNVIRVLDALNEGKKLNEIIDWYNTPTFVDDFVNIASSLIENNKVGVYNLVGSEFVNRVKWANIIANVFEKNKSLINPINSESLKLPAKRPNAHISNHKAERETGTKFHTIEESLILMKKQL